MLAGEKVLGKPVVTGVSGILLAIKKRLFYSKIAYFASTASIWRCIMLYRVLCVSAKRAISLDRQAFTLAQSVTGHAGTRGLRMGIKQLPLM